MLACCVCSFHMQIPVSFSFFLVTIFLNHLEMIGLWLSGIFHCFYCPINDLISTVGGMGKVKFRGFRKSRQISAYYIRECTFQMFVITIDCPYRPHRSTFVRPTMSSYLKIAITNFQSVFWSNFKTKSFKSALIRIYNYKITNRNLSSLYACVSLSWKSITHPIRTYLIKPKI